MPAPVGLLPPATPAMPQSLHSSLLPMIRQPATLKTGRKSQWADFEWFIILQVNELMFMPINRVKKRGHINILPLEHSIVYINIELYVYCTFSVFIYCAHARLVVLEGQDLRNRVAFLCKQFSKNK